MNSFRKSSVVKLRTESELIVCWTGISTWNNDKNIFFFQIKTRLILRISMMKIIDLHMFCGSNHRLDWYLWLQKEEEETLRFVSSMTNLQTNSIWIFQHINFLWCKRCYLACGFAYCGRLSFLAQYKREFSMKSNLPFRWAFCVILVGSSFGNPFNLLYFNFYLFRSNDYSLCHCFFENEWHFVISLVELEMWK